MEQWADRKAAECVFSGLKAHDSAWLIKKCFQETLVRSIPSSPFLSFLQYTLSAALLPLLHSLPLIYNFRRSYLHKQFSVKNKVHIKDILPQWSVYVLQKDTWLYRIGLVKDSCIQMSPLHLSRQKYIRCMQPLFSICMTFCCFPVIHFQTRRIKQNAVKVALTVLTVLHSMTIPLPKCFSKSLY